MKIIAHRGYTKSRPENTLPSFQEALRRGADSIELDVHFSLDSKLVVFHDYDLGKITGGAGLIPRSNTNYIRSLDAGAWYNASFAGTQIPLLSEVFEAFSTHTLYEIELKGFTDEFLAAVSKLVKLYEVVENIEFTSPHAYVLTRIKTLLPTCKTGMFASPLPDWMDTEIWRDITKNQALMAGINVIHFPVSMLTSDYVNLLHEQHLLVHAADCNTQKDIELAYLLKVDQFSTNELDNALKIRRDHEK